MLINAKGNALIVAEGVDEVYAFDPVGRLFSAYRSRTTFKRGLSGRVVQKWGEKGNWQRRDLTDAAWRHLLSDVHGRVEFALQQLRHNEAEVRGNRAAAQKQLEAVLAFDAARYEADRRRFAQVYRPVGILPPDQYLALLVQATEGCWWNRCTFCDFYRDQPFRIKPLPELKAHLEEIRAYFGPALALRRSIFLAAANALVEPMSRLVPAFEEVRAAFPTEEGFDGIYAFLDAFSAERKSEDDYRRLARLGLRRVYVGLESGHNPLLAWLDKPGQAEDAVEAVRVMRAAGLHVGVIVMVGVGGESFGAGHVEETVRILNRMELGPGDIVYLSDFVEHPGSDYQMRARQDGVTPLPPAARQRQGQALRAGLRFPGSAPPISRYDIHEFLY